MKLPANGPWLDASLSKLSSLTISWAVELSTEPRVRIHEMNSFGSLWGNWQQAVACAKSWNTICGTFLSWSVRSHYSLTGIIAMKGELCRHHRHFSGDLCAPWQWFRRHVSSLSTARDGKRWQVQNFEISTVMFCNSQMVQLVAFGVLAVAAWK